MGAPPASDPIRPTVAVSQLAPEDRPQATATKAPPRQPPVKAAAPVDNVFMVRPPNQVVPAMPPGKVPAPRAVGPALMARLQEVGPRAPGILEELKAAVLAKL